MGNTDLSYFINVERVSIESSVSSGVFVLFSEDLQPNKKNSAKSMIAGFISLCANILQFCKSLVQVMKNK